MTDISSPEVKELAEDYLETHQQYTEAVGEWIQAIQEEVNERNISYEAASLAIEFKAQADRISEDPELEGDVEEWNEAYLKTLRRGFMLPDWRPDYLGVVDVLERPNNTEEEYNEEDGE